MAVTSSSSSSKSRESSGSNKQDMWRTYVMLATCLGLATAVQDPLVVQQARQVIITIIIR